LNYIRTSIKQPIDNIHKILKQPLDIIIHNEKLEDTILENIDTTVNNNINNFIDNTIDNIINKIHH
jgi:hypothetical protein